MAPADNITVKPRRVNWSDQSGFGLIEVLVSAVVMVLVATATVSSIGSSQRQSSRTLARGVAGNLAEQDQERMRAYRASDLVSYVASNDIVRGKTTYTVNSKTSFVAGPDEKEVSCTSTGEQSRFLQLITTVTPHTQAGFSDPPQTVKSLYALPIAQFSPTSGTLVVQINNFDGSSGQPNVPVTISGPESRAPVSTNSAGCAVFQFLASGAYTVTVDTAGWVDKNLRQQVVLTANVNQGTITQTTPFQYEPAGLIDLSVDANGTTKPWHSRGASLTNSSLELPTHRETAFPRPDDRKRVDGLFPFAEPYHLYSGTCLANDPSLYDATYYTAHGAYGSQVVTPGGAHSATLREPTISAEVQLKQSSGPGNATNDLQGAPVTLLQYDAGCANSGGQYPQYSTTTLANGGLDVGYYPFGHYLVCAQYTDPHNGKVWRSAYAKVDNTAFAGVSTPASATLIDSTQTPNGTCASGLDAARAAAQPAMTPVPTPMATP